MDEYIRATGTDRSSIWGTDIEILAIAHMLNTCVYIYVTQQGNWLRYRPCDVDRSLQPDDTRRAMYIRHIQNHFDVVCSTVN